MGRAPIISSSVLAGLLLLAQACSTDPERAKRQYFDSGNHYFDQKKYREAAIQYSNALKQDPLFGEARYRLAESYLQIGNVTAASGEYSRAADLLPDDREVQIKAATILLLTGQFEDANNLARRVLIDDPNNVK